MCRESDVPLVFSPDPSVKSRLQLPSGGHRLTEDDIYPDRARRLSFEGSVVVTSVVELDGTVQHSKIMQSRPPSARLCSQCFRVPCHLVAALADHARVTPMFGRSPACGSPLWQLRSNVATPTLAAATSVSWRSPQCCSPESGIPLLRVMMSVQKSATISRDKAQFPVRIRRFFVTANHPQA